MGALMLIEEIFGEIIERLLLVERGGDSTLRK
jgi:hypothetical protein